MVSELKEIDFFAVIAGRKQKDSLAQAMQEMGAKLVNTMYGKGSVKAGYLRDMLGFVPEDNKIVIVSLMKAEKSAELLKHLRDEFQFTEPNTGIAFTIPVEGISKFGRITRMESGCCAKALFIVVNAGFSDDVMDIARSEGATGATILNARGESAAQKVFMGITMDVEKEIVLTLVNEETAEKVMGAIREKAGMETPAHGVCFFMPVEKMTGLRALEQSGEST